MKTPWRRRGSGQVEDGVAARTSCHGCGDGGSSEGLVTSVLQGGGTRNGVRTMVSSKVCLFPWR
jgi:hypothetical protein